MSCFDTVHTISKIKYPQELLELSQLSLSGLELVAFHKRIDASDPDPRLIHYRARGCYLIHIKGSLYVGSTAAEGMYFGRRWKAHLSDKEKGRWNHCLTPYANEALDDISFHAIFFASQIYEILLIEAAIIAVGAMRFKEHLLNPIRHGDRKEMPANSRSQHRAKMIRFYSRKVSSNSISHTPALL